MNDVKKLSVDSWLADDLREYAKMQKLSVPAYVRRAIVRQLLEDLQLRQAQVSLERYVEAKVEA